MLRPCTDGTGHLMTAMRTHTKSEVVQLNCIAAFMRMPFSDDEDDLASLRELRRLVKLAVRTFPGNDTLVDAAHDALANFDMHLSG